MTSRDVVNIVQRRINIGRKKGERTKVGHTGTLDPLASGVLVLGVGAAVRLTNQIGQMKKTYNATFRLNQSTRSGDLDGELSHHDLPLPSFAEMRRCAAELEGQIEQTPPAHSAIHIDGVRAYKRVRAGEEVVMPTRKVQIDSIEITRFDPPEFDFLTVCGGGTYIRTLGMDIARNAGNVAVMTRLCRTAVGPFELAQSVDIETLRNGDLRPHWKPIVLAVGEMPQITVDSSDDLRLRHGVAIEMGDGHRKSPESVPAAENPPTRREDPRQTNPSMVSDPGKPPPVEVAAIGPAGDLRAIVVRRGNHWKPIRVFLSDSASTD